MTAPAAPPPPRAVVVLRPLALAVMAACVAWSLAELLQLLFPFWNLPWTVAGAVLAALEAALSYQLLRSRVLVIRDRWRLRAVELVFLLVVIKAGRYLGWPLAEVWNDLQAWPRETWRILDPETLVNFFVAVLVLIGVNDTLADLEALSDPERARSPVSPRDEIIARFFWGGLLLLVASGIARIGVEELLNVARPPVTGLVINALVYFGVGMVVIGQANYTHLAALWQAEGVPVAANLGGRWARHSLWFLLLVGVIAFSLPTFYGEGALGLVGTLFWLVGLALYTVAWVISALLVGLVNLLAPPPADGILPPVQTVLPPTPTVVPTSAPPPGAPLPLDPALELLRSVLFWALIAGMVAYVVIVYLRERPELLQALKNARLFRALRQFLVYLWRQTGQLAEALRELRPLERLRDLLGQASGQAARFFRLGAASPREQVMYFYLSTLRRAAQLGFPRRPPQTPDEYDPVLETKLTEAQAEVHALTEAFSHARYRAEPPTPAEAKTAREAWERVRQALVKMTRRQQPGAKDRGPQTGGQ